MFVVVVVGVVPAVVVVVGGAVRLLCAPVIGPAGPTWLPGGWGTVNSVPEPRDPGSQDDSQDVDEDVGGDRHGPAPGGGGVRNVKVLLAGGVVFGITVCSWSDAEL